MRFNHQAVSRAAFLSLILLLLGACGGGGGSSSSGSTTPDAISDDSTANDSVDVAETAEPQMKGNVSNGLAFPEASVDLVWSGGIAEDVATTDEFGNYNFSVPQFIGFPMVFRVDKGDGTYLETVVTGNEDEYVNLNPITTIATQLVVGEIDSSDLTAAQDFTGVTEEIFEQTGDTVTGAIFGEGVTFDTFHTEAFHAKTEGDATSGGLADTLIDVVSGLDPTKSVEDILASALDPNDPSFAGELLGEPSFQTRLAGELIGQGHSAEEALEILGEGTEGDSPASAFVETAGGFLTSFEALREDAEANGVDPSIIERLIQSSAKITSDMVDGGDFDGNEDLAALVANVCETAGPALVDVARDPENADLVDGGEFAHMMDAMAEEVGNMMEEVGGDLTRVLTPGEQAVMQAQMEGFAEVMAGPMADGMRNPAMDDMSPEEIAVIMETMGHHLGDTVGGYINELGEGTIPPEVFNSADNMGGPMFDAMMTMMGDEQVEGMDVAHLQEMAGAIGDVSAEQLGQFDLSQANVDLGDVEYLLHNLAGMVTDMGANPNVIPDGMGSEAGAHVLGATLDQALATLMDLEAQGKFDLRGSEIPEGAMYAADNIAEMMGPALANSVADASNRAGQDLEMLLSGAAAGTMEEFLGFAPDLTTEFDHEQYEEEMNRYAVESAIALEQSFQQIEASGIDLGDITQKFSDIGLDPAAIGLVATQMAQAFGAEGDQMPSEGMMDAAHIFAEMAAQSANNALEMGGSLEDARNMVSMTTTTLMDVGEHGGFYDIRESAYALQEGMDFAVDGGQYSVEDMYAFTQDMGTVISASVEQHFGPVDEFGNPLPPGDCMDCEHEGMYPEDQHVNFDDMIKFFHEGEHQDGGELFSMEDMAGQTDIEDYAKFDEIRAELERVAMEQAAQGEQMFNEFDELAVAALANGSPDGDFHDIYNTFNPEQEHLDLPEGVSFEDFKDDFYNGGPSPEECAANPEMCGAFPGDGFVDDGTYFDDGQHYPGDEFVDDGTYFDDGSIPPACELDPASCGGLYPEDGFVDDGTYFDDGQHYPGDGFVDDGTYFDDGTISPECEANPASCVAINPEDGFVDDGTYFDDGTIPPECEADPASCATINPVDGTHPDGFVDDGTYFDDGTHPDGFVDDGTYFDDGTHPDGFVDDGVYFDDGTYPDGFVDDGTYFDDGTHPDGFVDDGTYFDDGTHPDGFVDDGVYFDDGTHPDGFVDDGTYFDDGTQPDGFVDDGVYFDDGGAAGFVDDGTYFDDGGAAGFVDDGTYFDDGGAAGFVDDGTYFDDGNNYVPPADDGFVDDGVYFDDSNNYVPPADDGFVDDGTYFDDGNNYVPPADDGGAGFQEPIV